MLLWVPGYSGVGALASKFWNYPVLGPKLAIPISDALRIMEWMTEKRYKTGYESAVFIKGPSDSLSAAVGQETVQTDNRIVIWSLYSVRVCHEPL